MPRAATNKSSRKASVEKPAEKPATGSRRKAAAAAAAPVSEGRVTKKRVKKTKDVNAPKRPLSAYMYFSQEKRPEVKKTNPDATFGSIGKILGQMWTDLGESDKKPYLGLAQKDKVRYESEKKAVAAAN
ncbi:Non-histone chromosomal protein 6 [Coemansia sp. RSA 988]|nr:Non-histone chromosomal protein 6 [Coemansia sp. RSA 988]